MDADYGRRWVIIARRFTYLHRVIERDLAFATFATYAAAIEKLETALNRYAHTHGTGREYRFDLKEVRASAADQLERFHETRAYTNPSALVKAVQVPDLALAAQIMYEGGPRVREASQINRSQLAGIGADSQTGRERGFITVEGKGGKEYTVAVKPETYKALKTAINQGLGMFKVTGDDLRQALKEAATKTNQTYTGSHGLRWNHAQERMTELQEYGFTYEKALSVVSTEMGHNRADITEHYLGK